MNQTAPSISVVTSLYKSQDYVHEFYRRIKKVLDSFNCEYEFIFILDGPTDNADEKVKELIEQDVNVKLIELSRNFGHQSAMLAGVEH